MTLARPTAPTRRLEPSWRPWTPEPYQLRGSDHLQARAAGVLWLDPGMRKTSIVLHAFCALKARGVARKLLVVAPRKVCQLVWRQEAAKWEEFRHLTFRYLHGPKKAKLLAEDADVYLINPEGAAWLAKQYGSSPDAWPFDTVAFDELTKFKNSQSDRSKALRGRSVGGRMLPNLLKRAQRRWGMTGTPNPNGYMDLFGQFLMLDDGAALGRFITHYRDTYFTVGWNGFDYELQPGAEKRIQARLAPYVFALESEDYIKLPELQNNVIEIDLEPEAWAAYTAMRDDMVAELGGDTVEAANTAAAYTKLSQMAGGAVYLTADVEGQPSRRQVVEIHTAKLDALSDLIDEMGDKQLLIGYEFQHEMDRMKARFGDRMAFLSEARTDAQAEEMQRDWNSGRIQLMACHPASAGHGLNLQEGNAAHLCWFGPIWDLELWDQFIRRLRRSGNTAARILRHILVVRNSIDELKLQALAEKDTSQGRLKRALATVLGGVETDPKETDMVMKLQRAGAAAPAATEERRVPSGWGAPKGDSSQLQAATSADPAESQTAAVAPAAEERKAPAGWGRPAGAAPSAAQEQREEIREKLNPPVEEVGQPIASSEVTQTTAFSDNVIALKGQVEAGDDSPLPDVQAPKATRSRAPSTATPPAGLSVGDITQAVRDVLNEGRPTSAADEPAQADWAISRRVERLNSLLHGAKAAAEGVAILSSVNADASAEVYTLLFGAIEREVALLGYDEAA